MQNQKKPSQLGNLINLFTGKIAHKGKNYSLKLRKYYFCTRTWIFSRLPALSVVHYYNIIFTVIFMEAKRVESMVQTMQAEREMCLQDVATFKKLREELKARERKPWFTFDKL